MATRRRPRPTARPALPVAVRPPAAPAGRSARVARVAVLPVALALTVGGCSTTNPMTTMSNYSASDGVRVDLGEVLLGNMLVLAAEEGAPGTVLGSVHNGSKDETTVTIALGEGEPVLLRVRSGETVLLGPDQDEELELDSVPAAPGANVEMTFGSEIDGSQTVPVPVLDGTLPEYADLVPDAGRDAGDQDS